MIEEETDVIALDFRNMIIIHNKAWFIFINVLPRSQEALHEWPAGNRKSLNTQNKPSICRKIPGCDRGKPGIPTGPTMALRRVSGLGLAALLEMTPSLSFLQLTFFCSSLLVGCLCPPAEMSYSCTLVSSPLSSFTALLLLKARVNGMDSLSSFPILSKSIFKKYVKNGRKKEP